ncbi:MAG: hypothetical protein Q7S08_00645 [bacterium]|nr:hypothetical protein [bacterium]
MTTTKMPGESTISKDWKPIYRRWWFWVLATPLILFIAIVIYRIPFVIEKEKTQQVIAQIHAQKLTINDVNGEHLPPPPDPTQVDATIEGVDANGNGIRDDVELAIFKKYPNSAKIRAAELQYAKALQKEFTSVFNSETLVAVIQEEGRGSVCILNSKRTQEIEDLVFNTDARKKAQEDLYRKFMTSYALPNSDYCDIDPKILAN